MNNQTNKHKQTLFFPQVLSELSEVSPTVFGSVPRIYEKAFVKIMAARQELHGLRVCLCVCVCVCVCVSVCVCVRKKEKEKE